MAIPIRQIVNATASSSRLVNRSICRRCLSTSARKLDVSSEPRSTANHRETIERQRKAFEEKYGDKLKQKAEAEGVRDVDALKVKVMAPSVKRALLAKQSAQKYSEQKTMGPDTAAQVDTTPRSTASAQTARTEQAKGDRAGIKPLGSILNLDILQGKTHTADEISKIWTAHHTTHPSLSASFLSAFLPSSTYDSMLKLAMENPFFVLPLPREAATGETGAEIKMGEYEMFYLQWLFHPTPTPTVKPSVSSEDKPDRPPYTSSVIFTPLEEFKKAGEWATPHLVVTHYPELAHSHDLVLMRAEISAASETGPRGSLQNPGYLLSQQRAQLLALALQRFYCANIDSSKESPEDRAKRIQTLRDFREKPEEWNWQGLVDMAYGGLL